MKGWMSGDVQKKDLADCFCGTEDTDMGVAN